MGITITPSNGSGKGDLGGRHHFIAEMTALGFERMHGVAYRQRIALSYALSW